MATEILMPALSPTMEEGTLAKWHVKEGDVVKVKPGYARNYLLPQGKAMNSTKANMAIFEAQKAQLEATNLETKKEAEAMADKLGGQQFIVIRQASGAGALYGSVTTRDAAEAATAEGFTVDRGQVVLERPIKELGVHDVTVRLHPEVDTSFALNVARSAEEAELQASGKSIQELAAEAEAEAEFEIAELFDDIGAAASEDEELAEAVESPAEDASEGDDETA